MKYGFPKAVGVLRVLVPTVLAVGLIGAPASAAPAPIKIGGLFTEGASVGFPTSGSRTVKSFFKDFNARGGFKGRKVQVATGNDGFSVEKNVALTKQMIDEGVVAFVGNEAAVDCLGNNGFYRQSNVRIIGYGGGQACFALPNFGAVGQSIQTGIVLSAQYAKQNLGGKVCLLGYAIPGSEVVYKAADQMLAKLGTRWGYRNTNIAPTADPTAALLSAKNAGCRSVVAQVGPGQGIQLVNSKATQRVKNVALFLQNNHDQKFLRATGRNANGNYYFSQLYPFTENDSKTKAFRRFCNKHNITPDPFSAIAYVSSQLFADALRNVKGSVTRDSVGRAISSLNVRNSMFPGGRFTFGRAGTGNAPNIGGFMVTVKGGKYVKAPKSEMTLPRSVRSLAGR